MSSSSRSPPWNCIRARNKICFCRKNLVIRVSKREWSINCLFYSCPEKNGGNFFQLCEGGDMTSNLQNDDNANGTSYLFTKYVVSKVTSPPNSLNAVLLLASAQKTFFNRPSSSKSIM